MSDSFLERYRGNLRRGTDAGKGDRPGKDDKERGEPVDLANTN